MVSLTEIQEIPPKNLILLVGSPGVGKTAFCEQTVLQNLASDNPVIYVTTKSSPSEVEKDLRERGLIDSRLISFIDAYNETVGLSVSDRPDTLLADCEDLSSIGIAISKLEERSGKKGNLLVFDSLTSPYLFSRSEILRFLRRTLSSFAAKGNSVLACFDEGSGKEEDLVAMMSISTCVLRIEAKQGTRTLHIVKHPRLSPTSIEVPTDEVWEKKIIDSELWDRENVKRITEGIMGGKEEVLPALEINVFWLNLARWSAIFWNPKKLPEIIYNFAVEYSSYAGDMIALSPWHIRLIFKMLIPNSFSNVKDMKKLFQKFLDPRHIKPRRYGIVEYLEDISKTDEHYFRVHECFECCGLENVGTTLALSTLYIPGICQGFEKEERHWNAIETKCMGLGDPYCEFKLVPRETDELERFLEKDSSVTARIHDRIMERLMGFMLHEKPLVERPRLGANFLMGGEMNSFAMAREMYRTATRLGAARLGKEVGECLFSSGFSENEAEKRLLHLFRHCKVGKVSLGKTIKMEDSRESLWTKFYPSKWKEPCCYFTTGFLNGFFSTIKNQHVREIRCIAMGDPYCEWEFR